MQITLDTENVVTLVELLQHAIEKGTVQYVNAFAKTAEKTLAELSRQSASVVVSTLSTKVEGSEEIPPHKNKIGLIDANEVATLLKVSPRTVWRLNDAGKMPKSVRIGSLVRWNSEEIAEWMAAKCPAREQRGVRRTNG